MEWTEDEATIAGAIYPKCIVDVASKIQLGGPSYGPQKC
jgi:hypothetical protein